MRFLGRIPLCFLVLLLLVCAVDSLDVTGIVNATNAANDNIRDLKGQAKSIFGRLADVQEKIAWAQTKLANVSSVISCYRFSRYKDNAWDISLQSIVALFSCGRLSNKPLNCCLIIKLE